MMANFDIKDFIDYLIVKDLKVPDYPSKHEEMITAIADHYGYDVQSRQCIEEMAELTQAINKFWRRPLKCGKVDLLSADHSNKEYVNLLEELADVKIMIEQMIVLLSCENIIADMMDAKLVRQIKRIEDDADG